MTAPMKITSTKLPAAPLSENWPVSTAASANRNTISAEASLSRLSPSSTLVSTFGTFTCRRMVVAEMASGGETMPPSKKPSASVKPGMRAWATTATRHEVRMTMGKAKLAMRRRARQNSFHDTCQAAS